MLYNDVAIIKTEESLNFTSHIYIKPICLPSESSLPSSMVRHSVTTQGYGRDQNGNIGSKLTQIDVTIRWTNFLIVAKFNCDHFICISGKILNVTKKLKN